MPFLIILALVVLLIGFYLVIKAAVKDAIYESDATKLLVEIRDLLKMQSMERKAVNIPYTSEEGDGREKDGVKCPACGARISENDRQCPSCGISLSDSK